MKKHYAMSTVEPITRALLTAFLLLMLSTLSGCAHDNPRDPLEPFNRGVYAFNDGLDRAVLKPVAQGYQAVLPQVMRTGVGNFFSNLDDITVFLNNVLQLKLTQAASDFGRFLINSTVGLLGFIDVATHFGMEKHNEDFGQTLGYWGIGNGPYLVIPLLGPSSFRDALGRFADSYTDVVWQLDHMRTRNQLYGTRAVQNRARVLETEKVLETAAIDEYAFVRDAYLQRRRNLVYDGNPPPETEDEEPQPKPRSESLPELRTVLVDQYGQVVAGELPTGGVVPVLREETSKAPPRFALPDSNRDDVQKTGVEAPAAPAIQEPLTAAPVPAETPVVAASPVIRVWLPGDRSK